MTILMVTSIFISGTVFGYQETRNLSGFNEISYSISGDLVITQGSEFKVVVEGSEDDVKEIVTKIEGNNLIIKKGSRFKNLGDTKVYVTLPELTALSLAGSGDTKTHGTFKTEEFELSLAGSGDAKFSDLQVSEIEVSIAGSGDVILNGEAKSEMEVSIAGSGDIDAKNFKAREVEVSIAGSGSATVYATEKLETDIVGSGDVFYKGNPKVDAQAIGSGRTRAL